MPHPRMREGGDRAFRYIFFARYPRKKVYRSNPLRGCRLSGGAGQGLTWADAGSLTETAGSARKRLPTPYTRHHFKLFFTRS